MAAAAATPQTKTQRRGHRGLPPGKSRRVRVAPRARIPELPAAAVTVLRGWLPPERARADRERYSLLVGVFDDDDGGGGGGESSPTKRARISEGADATVEQRLRAMAEYAVRACTPHALYVAVVRAQHLETALRVSFVDVPGVRYKVDSFRYRTLVHVGVTLPRNYASSVQRLGEPLLERAHDVRMALLFVRGSGGRYRSSCAVNQLVETPGDYGPAPPLCALLKQLGTLYGGLLPKAIVGVPRALRAAVPSHYETPGLGDASGARAAALCDAHEWLPPPAVFARYYTLANGSDMLAGGAWGHERGVGEIARLVRVLLAEQQPAERARLEAFLRRTSDGAALLDKRAGSGGAAVVAAAAAAATVAPPVPVHFVTSCTHRCCRHEVVLRLRACTCNKRVTFDCCRGHGCEYTFGAHCPVCLGPDRDEKHSDLASQCSNDSCDCHEERTEDGGRSGSECEADVAYDVHSDDGTGDGDTAAV